MITGKRSHSTCSLVVLVAFTPTGPDLRLHLGLGPTRVTLLSLRYGFTIIASSAGLGVALARDLVLACIQNSEHVSWLHAFGEAISYLCRCRYPVDAVSSFLGGPLPYAFHRHRISIGVWGRALFVASYLEDLTALRCSSWLLGSGSQKASHVGLLFCWHHAILGR